MEGHDLFKSRLQLTSQQWGKECDDLPHHIVRWLLYSGSLTEKLIEICSNFQVEIVEEGWQAVTSSENFAKQWVREVLLKCGDQELIFAQTILPDVTIENVAQEILHLGNQPIGLWLFPQKPQRLHLEWRQDSETGLYARRAQYLLHGYPIEIKELFLAQFPFEK